LFTSVDELKLRIQENHTNQTLRYWFDSQLGYVLRNIESDERIQFYPSDNTSFFDVNDLPLVNTSIDLVLNQFDGDDLLEKLKRPNSKWRVESIYEYVLLTTPLPEVPIGSSVILPDFIRNSKSIVSFQNVPYNLCFWYCLAHQRYTELRLDRLSTKAKNLYKDFYKSKAGKMYSGVEIQELDQIETHFSVNINVYRFNGKKAVMERHSKKTYKSTLS
jgi:stress-induced morphogen